MLQGRSFRKANGVIFLSQFARDFISVTLGDIPGSKALIPHGVEPRFFSAPKRQRSREECSFENPFKLLYVSLAMPYKHQIEVVRAVHGLRKQGLPIQLTLAGSAAGKYSEALKKTISELDPGGQAIIWNQEIPFEALHHTYHSSDAFLFASSCENLPNILIEAMASGLPIVSSDRGPMKEVLGDSAIFFNPYCPSSISSTIEKMVSDPELRAQLAGRAFEIASGCSWKKCSQATFDFIATVSADFHGKHL